MGGGLPSDDEELSFPTLRRIGSAASVSAMHRVGSSESVSNMAKLKESRHDLSFSRSASLSTTASEMRRAVSPGSVCTMASHLRVSSSCSLCSTDPEWEEEEEGLEMEISMTIEGDRPQESGAVESLPTTVVIRNIPRWYVHDDLTSELEELGFADTYDYLYLPTDSGTMSNGGYAFVNFLDQAQTSKCLQVFQTHNFCR